MTSNSAERDRQRVFCIGMNKTGTSTMKACFNILDMVPVASPKTMSKEEKKIIKDFHDNQNYQSICQLAENYITFEDRPWNMWELYRHLDNYFPNSLFILTIRDSHTWWKSVEHWLTVTKPNILQLYKKHLRICDFSQATMVESYERHNSEIIEYFKDTQKLLVINFENGEGWEKLCSFLNKPIPNYDFPHRNKQQYMLEDDQRVEVKKIKKGYECEACGHINDSKKTSNKKKSTNQIKTNSCIKKVFKKLSYPIRRIFKILKKMRDSHSVKKFQSISSQQENNERIALIEKYPNVDSSTLAIVTCFFNPTHSIRRVKNFNFFMEGIKKAGVHMLVVECAFNSRDHEIDHEHVIQLRSNDIMWHKERLLNIGIQRLIEEGYEKIAWLDADIKFQTPDWPKLISATLEECNLCQVFSEVLIHDNKGVSFSSKSSLKSLQMHGDTRSNTSRGAQSGFGWAARAEIFKQISLYEHAVIGGGDKMMLMASVAKNTEDDTLKELTYSSIACENCGYRHKSAAYTSSYITWMKKWNNVVDRKVSYAPVKIEDMYHGKRSDRKYMVRRNILLNHQFDPQHDLVLEDNGCYRWSEHKQELHEEVKAYFLSRREH